jgi:hypothetical protein
MTVRTRDNKARLLGQWKILTPQGRSTGWKGSMA